MAAQAARQDKPAGSATLTEKAGTGRLQAANTGEPLEPERSQTRQPSAEAPRAKAEASANDENGTNKQAGAGDHPAPPGSARRAHTQPHDNGRATMPAPREPKTETKPDITHPQGPGRKPDDHAARPKQQLKRKKREKKKTPSKTSRKFQKSMWRTLRDS
jgi:hypothetical protein